MPVDTACNQANACRVVYVNVQISSKRNTILHTTLLSTTTMRISTQLDQTQARACGRLVHSHITFLSLSSSCTVAVKSRRNAEMQEG